MSKAVRKKKKEVFSGALKRFRISCEPYRFSDGAYELRWEIVSDGEVFTNVQGFRPDDFTSVIDYVTKKAYAELREMLGLTYREEL